MRTSRKIEPSEQYQHLSLSLREHRPGDVLAQHLEEFHDLRTTNGALEEAEIEAREGDPGDHRRLLPAEAVFAHREGPAFTQVR